METRPLSAWRPEGQWQSSWFWDNFRCHAELEAVYADLTKPFDWRIGREEYRRSLFSDQSEHCWCCGRCYITSEQWIQVTVHCSVFSIQCPYWVLSEVSRSPSSLRMVFSWFSSSADKDKVETERSGYECAPYTVLETTPGYQVNTGYWLGFWMQWK